MNENRVTECVSCKNHLLTTHFYLFITNNTSSILLQVKPLSQNTPVSSVLLTFLIYLFCSDSITQSSPLSGHG